MREQGMRLRNGVLELLSTLTLCYVHITVFMLLFFLYPFDRRRLGRYVLVKSNFLMKNHQDRTTTKEEVHGGNLRASSLFAPLLDFTL